jgi:hypothetical protein
MVQQNAFPSSKCRFFSPHTPLPPLLYHHVRANQLLFFGPDDATHEVRFARKKQGFLTDRTRPVSLSMGPSNGEFLARYRLRFLLQEFDLPPGETLIGRGPDCRITLVDPLVSRHHAKVRIEGARALIEDLGSRNGSRVNARLIRGQQVLKDGDRIRIGTQELVFSEVESVQLATNKQTGFLCHCSSCRLPYPEEMGACPNCGATEVEEENTLSGILDDRGRQNWALQMLIEMLRKALTLGRESDADRIMQQATANVDERLHAHDTIDESQLEALSLAALKLCEMQKKASWAKWILETYRRSARLPPRSVAESVSKLPAAELHTLVEQLDDLVSCAPVSKLSPSEVEGLASLKTIRATLQGG